jgi:hypothetical protein
MTNDNSGNRGVLISYYKGAYGPTIRVDTRSIDDIAQIKNVFLDLAAAKVYEVKFHEIRSWKITDIEAFVLRLLPEGKEHKKTLKLVQTSSEGLVFHWSRSPEGWMECAELLDGILNHQRPGHQYLTDEAVDDALVEVAFLET